MTKQKKTKQRKPQKRTIKQVMDYLHSIDLSVYGVGVDLDTGELYAQCRDYCDADEIVKYAKLRETTKFWTPDYNKRG